MLKDVPATDLRAVAIAETLRRASLDSARASVVVMGNVIRAGNRMNPARHAAIGAGMLADVRGGRM